MSKTAREWTEERQNRLADDSTVRQCVVSRDYKWPEGLTSGVMYYYGRKVTIEAFVKQKNLMKAAMR